MMDDYQDGELRDAEEEEEKVERIRAIALERAQKINPDVLIAVDRHSLDEYCIKKWDYPGAWYSKGFKLPDGFNSVEELINSIVKDTLKYYEKKNNIK